MLVTLCCEGGGEAKAQVRNRPASTRHDGARTSGGKGETHETARARTLCNGPPHSELCRGVLVRLAASPTEGLDVDGQAEVGRGLGL